MKKVREWTEARYRTFVVSALRAALRRWPPKYKVLKAAAVERKINALTGKMAMHYKCAACEEHFPATGVQVDHIKPVVDPKKGFVSWDVYIERIYCDAKGLQVLCKPCHASKTKAERNARVTTRRKETKK